MISENVDGRSMPMGVVKASEYVSPSDDTTLTLTGAPGHNDRREIPIA